MDIIWLDDSPDRVQSTIVNRTISLKEQVVQKVIENELFSEDEPDLIIIDHFLTSAGNDGESQSEINAEAQGILAYGSIVADTIRAKWPTCPIIGVSSAKKRERVVRSGSSAELSYLTVIDFNDFTENEKLVEAIAEDFSQLTTFPDTDRTQYFLELLKAPKVAEIDDFLLSCLPFDLADDNDIFLPHNIATWILNDFMKKAGFLINQRYLASYLGLKSTSVEKVSDNFDDALYQGVFANDDSKLWWAAAIRPVLEGLIKDSDMMSSQMAGRQLSGIEEVDYSRSLSEELANVLAYTDNSLTKLVDAEMSETEMIDSRVGLGFEPTRIITGS